MGRGRAKAKQTKVARELKYRSVDTDFTSLEREMRGGEMDGHHIPDAYADYDEDGADLDEREDLEDLDERDEPYGSLRRSG